MSQQPAPQIANPLFIQDPSGANAYYINSVAVTSNGSSVVAGTFFKNYQSTAPATDARRILDSTAKPAGGAAPVTPSESGTFGTYCYDQSGNQLWKDEYQGWQGIFWVDAASKAPVCAAGGWYSNDPYQGIIRVYNSANGDVLYTAFTGSRVNQVSLSSDGSLLLTAAEALCLFKQQGNTYVKLGGPMLEQANDSVTTAFLAGNGSYAVCATLNNGVFLFEVQTTGLVQVRNWTWPDKGGSCHSVAVNSEGSAFAVGGSSGIYCLFDIPTFIQTGLPVLTCTAPNNAVVYSVAVTDAGDGIVAVANVCQGNTQGQVLFNSLCPTTSPWTFNTAKSPNRVVLNTITNQVAVADGHPDGCRGTFYLLDATTGDEIWQYTSGNMCWGIALDPNGSLVAGGSDDSNVYGFLPTGTASIKA